MKKPNSIDPLVKKANAKIQKWIALGDQSADLDLSSLTSAVGLTLPESVGADLDLGYNLTNADRKALRERHPNLAEKIKDLWSRLGGDFFSASD